MNFNGIHIAKLLSNEVEATVLLRYAAKDQNHFKDLLTALVGVRARCKNWPEYEELPSDSDFEQFDKSLKILNDALSSRDCCCCRNDITVGIGEAIDGLKEEIESLASATCDVAKWARAIAVEIKEK